MSVSVSKAVRMALTKGNKRQTDLVKALGLSSSQSVFLKLQKERWTGTDLAKVAELTGGKLAFFYPDGTEIRIPQANPEESAEPLQDEL